MLPIKKNLVYKKKNGSDDRSFHCHHHPQVSIAALDKVAVMTMSTAKSCIDCMKYRNIIILSVLLLFGGTVEHLSEAKGGGCVIGSPKRRLSFVKPTCKLDPVHIIRGGDLSEEDDEFEDDNLDGPIGNEIISSFHIELQRIRSEMVAEAIREMDLLRDELLRKKQERKNRRLTLRQSSDGFHSEYDDSNAIKDGFTETTNDNDDDDDDVTNSIKTDEKEPNETEQEETFSNDDDDETNVDTGELLEEGEGDEEEFDDDDDDFDEDELEESQHEITMQDENDEEVAEEVTTNSDFVMGDTDEYDDSNVIHEVVDNQNESSKQDDDKQQFHDQFNDDEILEESQDDDDTTIQTDEYAEENHESEGIPQMDEIQSEEQDIENLTQASVITNTMQEYTDDSDKEVNTEQSKLKKKKKKSKKKRKKGKKKKRKTKTKNIEKLSTSSITKPTTTFTELQKPTSTKVRSKSLKQELIKVLLFLVAFILSQITMSFIFRMLKSTTNE